jgi:hypothetical protein
MVQKPYRLKKVRAKRTKNNLNMGLSSVKYKRNSFLTFAKKCFKKYKIKYFTKNQ